MSTRIRTDAGRWPGRVLIALACCAAGGRAADGPAAAAQAEAQALKEEAIAVAERVLEAYPDDPDANALDPQIEGPRSVRDRSLQKPCHRLQPGPVDDR